MPSTYAHQHFGNLVFDKLPEKLQEEIAPYRGLYNIGLQGPDIFFYYKPLHKNDVAAYGGSTDRRARRFSASAFRYLRGWTRRSSRRRGRFSAAQRVISHWTPPATAT